MIQMNSMDDKTFRARQKSIELDDIFHIPVQIAYTDIGEGEPIVLLHGIPTWSYLYNSVIPLLASKYRVIAPDFLGHGWSDKRDRFDRSLIAQAKMLLRFFDALELDRVNLVGHDTGGGVGLILGIEAKDRLKRLILSNIVAYDSWPIDDMLMLGSPLWKSKSTQEIVAYLTDGLSEGISRPEQLTSEFKEGIVAPYANEEGKISLIRNASALNTNHTMALVDRHKDILSPTLLLWGIDDPWQTIQDGQRLKQEIPNSKLVCIQNASHWIPQDAPGEFADEIIQFIESTSAC
ncbi:alpha/beta fold hydrolase [Synechococcus sp. PCC 7336]|uniref:alpha/beta fold hydrolase n=1 Tax=Synechococcus sp. PCC 7336 TaxID=195250 RepID=UPI000348E83B|nr:alpha/beta hydrolase [Synechococcus sp. PCC 7336]